LLKFRLLRSDKFISHNLLQVATLATESSLNNPQHRYFIRKVCSVTQSLHLPFCCSTTTALA